jgi:hypothetical protein
MVNNVPDVGHGEEEFTSQQGGEDTGAKSKHGDVSIDLPVEGNSNLSVQATSGTKEW